MGYPHARHSQWQRLSSSRVRGRGPLQCPSGTGDSQSFSELSWWVALVSLLYFTLLTEALSYFLCSSACIANAMLLWLGYKIPRTASYGINRFWAGWIDTPGWELRMRMRLVWMIPLCRLLIIILDWLGVSVIFACVGLDLVCTLPSHCYVPYTYICTNMHASRINDHIITWLNVWFTIHESIASLLDVNCYFKKCMKCGLRATKTSDYCY